MKDEVSLPSEETTKNPETGVEKMPQTTNIVHFVESIRTTDEYRRELEIRRSKLEASRATLNPDDLEPLTPDVLAKSWESRDEFKDFFFDYAMRVINLKYNPEIDPKIQTAFDNYKDIVLRMKDERNSNLEQTAVIELDESRGQTHNNVGRAIYEYLYKQGLYSNFEEDKTRGEILGRCIAWSWLVDLELESWTDGRFIDERRRARAVIDGLTLKIQSSYRPGHQLWFQTEESVLNARKVATKIFDTGELTEDFVSSIKQSSAQTAYPLHYLPPLTQSENQEHDTNPLRKRPFV